MDLDLAGLIDGWMKDLEIPGVGLGLIDGEERWTICAGVTSLENPQPVNDRTLFQIGSISKTFAGTAAMALVDRGQLDLDEPVRTYVPDLRLSTAELTATITTRHLLTHTTGWVGDYFGDTGQGDDALARFVVKLAKAPQLTPPGSVYSYNNSAFNLAALVIATITDSTYERAIEDIILRPLGMRTTFYSAQDAATRRVAVGHRNGVGQGWTRPRAHNGNGGVLSCVADLLTYAKFHMGEGAPIMSRGALDLMHTPAHKAGSLCDDVGIVWFIDQWAGQRMVHHGGTTNGYQADLRLMLDQGIAWTMLTNSDHNHQLDRLIREHVLGPDDPLEPFTPADVGDYVGRYEAVLADLAVRIDGDGLVVHVATPERARWSRDDAPDDPVPTRLAFRDADRVVALDMPFIGHRGEFLRGDDGTVEWFRWDGRIARRQ